MKKTTILLSAIASLCIVGCQKEIEIDQNAGALIGFEPKGWNSAEKPLTKADTAEVLPAVLETSVDSVYLHQIVTKVDNASSNQFHESMGVFGYAYTGNWDQTKTPNLIYNEKVTKSSSFTSTTRWPGGKGVNTRFFAYAPYDAELIFGLPTQNTQGTPVFSYEIPKNSSRQSDLLLACSDQIPSGSVSAAPLEFRHVLTGLRFVVGDDFPASTITEISISPVYMDGTISWDSNTWTVNKNSTALIFTDDISPVVSGQPDQDMTPGKLALMALPQTLPADAKLTIKYTDAATGASNTLSASVGGQTYAPGSIVTYRISRESEVWTYTFNVTGDSNFTYSGGSKYLNVQSYATNSQGQTKQVPWTAEFVEDDGTGNYTPVSQPSWITMATSGTGSQSLSTYVAAQTPIITDYHGDVLRATPAVSGVYDLSTKGGTAPMRTSNCYIINAPGTYKFPLVYGKAIDYKKYPSNGKNTSAYVSSSTYIPFVNHLGNKISDPYIYNNSGCVPYDAILVWQDAQGLLSNIALTSDKHSITFTVNSANITEGNAVVAVRDQSGTIMWSWHIWVTDFVPELPPTITMNYNPDEQQRDKTICGEYVLMGENVGFCYGPVVSYNSNSQKIRFIQSLSSNNIILNITTDEHRERRNMNNPFFQSARKDPLVPGLSGDRLKQLYYDDPTLAFSAEEAPTDVQYTIKNPTKHFVTKNASSLSDYSPLFNYLNAPKYYGYGVLVGKKIGSEFVETIYSPCPVGYILPPRYFTSFTSYNGNSIQYSYSSSSIPNTVNSFYRSKNDIWLNQGYIFYCNKMPSAGSYDSSAGVVFFPIVGELGGSGLVMRNYPNNGYSGFMSIYADQHYTDAVHMRTDQLHLGGTPFYLEGKCVRPIRED